METKYVKEFYEAMASEFDKTRYSLWSCVTRFLDGVGSGMKVLDVGCGNGKYLSYREDLTMYGCDLCESLVRIAKEKHPGAVIDIADGRQLPYRNGMFDAIISIAVLHHLENQKNRIEFISEISRVLKVKGKVLITVWASCMGDRRKHMWQDLGDNDFLIPWKKGVMRYYHLFEDEELIALCSKLFIIENIYYERDNWVISLSKER